MDKKGIEEGIVWLLIFCIIFLLIAVLITNFNPFVDCNTITNSTRITDCWFNR